MSFRVGCDRRGVMDRGPDVSQRMVQYVDQRVDCGRLIFASDNDSRASVGTQVLNERGNPIAMLGKCRVSRIGQNPELAGDVAQESFNVTRTQRQPMLGVGTGNCWRALSGIKTVH